MTTILLLNLWAPASEPIPVEWKVGSEARAGVVVAPKSAKETPTPVVFAFHGHGGNCDNAQRKMAIYKYWPECLAIYPQGLPTKGKFDPQGKRPGWQKAAGEEHDRDLKLFDAMLAWAKANYKVDETRIYATGHSNGAGFVYLLCLKRPGAFAAASPSAGGGRVREMQPLPILHLAAENDERVEYKNQRRLLDALKLRNGCAETAVDWAPGCKLFPSTIGAPVVEFIHRNGHKYPDEAPALAARFFKEHRKRDQPADSPGKSATDRQRTAATENRTP
jgi:polyhydroxybutyrate depolymerase